MTDKFSPVSIEYLWQFICQEFENKSEIFGIPQELFFKPSENDTFTTQLFGQHLDIPLGVAAGPHTQMAQNIIVAWLCGARYIELKTVQTLDELEISKPCIDMRDEGYNCEWSQELRINQAFDEYLKAWILIHLLNEKLFGKRNIGTIFNMSVGYNLEGILQENVQWFLKKMQNCQQEKENLLKKLKLFHTNLHSLNIPNCISNNITLSTMHGCPPDEIEKIALYLIENQKLNTFVKLNPTLLGAEELREILNKNNNFPSQIPDSAFEHDLKYPEALILIRNLQKAAHRNNVFFGVKLTNTLETLNTKEVFSEINPTMYLSGKALHPISILVAKKLQNDFNGTLNASFSAGCDCFNISEVLKCNLKPVTVCSDILKPGGYARLSQYVEEIRKEFQNVKNFENFEKQESVLENLKIYSSQVLENQHYKRIGFSIPTIKTQRNLTKFNCIAAPCVDSCPAHQDIPEYMFFAARGEWEKAFEVILRVNPFPTVTGMVCDHSCQYRCTRLNYDNELKIRDIKRFIAEQKPSISDSLPQKNSFNVAIIGAGPAGLACAYFLLKQGFQVTIFEKSQRKGGMPTKTIPTFRLTEDAVQQDANYIESLGAKIVYNVNIDSAYFEQLRKENQFIFIAVGASNSKKLELENSNVDGIFESLKFLENIRNNQNFQIGKKIGIIGGGNTAIDIARTCFRLAGKDGKVSLIYRRTLREMPAQFEEIQALITEGIEILELVSPEKIISENGKMIALQCSKMELSGKDKSGRPKPVKIPNSEFEIPLDTLIPALGQEIFIDFVENSLLQHDSETFETKLQNVFIGGDAVSGGATIVKAIADGRKIAEQIILRAGISHKKFEKYSKNLSAKELKIKRAKRIYGIEPKETEISTRKTFSLVNQGFTKEEVQKEAARCLFCDEICNVCVSVCPNLANYSYRTDVVDIQTFKIYNRNIDKDVEILQGEKFEISQTYQVINISDFCNECGNCATFCPTKDAPYKAKPKFYLSKEYFEKVAEGYFISKNNENLEIKYKTQNKLYSLENQEDTYFYVTPYVEVYFDKKDFSIKSFVVKNRGFIEENLTQAVEMSVLLNGVKNLYLF